MNISIQDNSFEMNHAENFGGAIYSEFSKLYLASTKNNSIMMNNARIFGGGLYSPKSSNKTLFNIDDYLIINNTANSIINNYTTKPSYIILDNVFANNFTNITTGNHLPLQFSIYDEYDHAIEDITNYYSSITLRITLEEKDHTNDVYENSNYNYNLIENIGTFVYGNIN